jgi:hypothetical protein
MRSEIPCDLITSKIFNAARREIAPPHSITSSAALTSGALAGA